MSDVPAGSWLEKGFFYRGALPPESKEWSTRDWMKLPLEHYLPFPKARLRTRLMSGARARRAGASMEELLRLCEALLHFQHHQTLNELQEDYEYFAPESGALVRAGVSGRELRRRERRFLENFLHALVKGQFVPLGQEVFKDALQRSYMMDVPAEVDWSAYDSRLLEDFHTYAARRSGPGRHLRERLGLAGSLREFLDAPEEVGDNAWVFFRGVDRDQVEGRFLRRKLGLLLEHLLRSELSLLVAPLEWAVRLFRGTRPAGTEDEEQPEQARSRHSRWARRKGLEQEPLLRSLFKVSRLQEPALRQVITLFRLNSREARSRRADDLPREKDWTIHIKTFSKIPFADSEVVFPEKIVRMRPFDVAMLILTAVAAIPALYQGVVVGKGAGFVVFALLVTFMWRLVSGYQRVRREYAARMTQVLYEKNLDNSVGVLQWLVDSLEAQEFKETILVYSLLLEEGRALSRSELDQRIERFLRKQLELECDFEIGDALAKVVDRGDGAVLLPIVSVSVVDGEEVYRAKPLDEALRTLDEKWDSAFQHGGPALASAC